MGLAKRIIAALLLTGAAAILLASSAFAQERAGVVTTVEGSATVARLTHPQIQPLRFKDDVFLRDRITTGERAFVRVLLGGRATVTARERSILTITEVPGVATIQLGEGRISVAVSRALMKPGQVIEIKTPNAVTAIRGTVVVAEVVPLGESHRSTMTILRGLVDVTRLDATAGPVGPAVKVGALQRVAVTGTGPVSPAETITQEAARRLASEFSLIPKEVPAASTAPLNATLKDAAIREAMQLAGSTTTPDTSGGAARVTTTTNTVGAVTGIVADTVGDVAGTATGVVRNLTGTATGTVGSLTGTATGALGTLTGTTTGALGGLTGATTGVVGGLTGTATGTVGTLIPPPASNPPANLVPPVLNAVTNTTSTVTDSLLNVPRR
jgi:FecR protein